MSDPRMGGARRSLWMLLAFALGCGPEPVHEPYYAAAGAHGAEFKLQVTDCRGCHGADLAGGVSDAGQTADSCDRCHQTDWRTDCTYCHGGQATTDGAPPRDLRGETVDGPFPHGPHISGRNHPAWGCAPCHAAPVDVLSAGHTADDSPGVAEVDFAAGPARDAQWDGAGCSNNACHGDGQAEGGDVALAEAPLGCDGCHPGPETPWSELSEMSGDHAEHAMHGVVCADCHPNVSAAGEIVDPTSHVDLLRTVQMPDAIVEESGHCTGRCHEEDHYAAAW